MSASATSAFPQLSKPLAWIGLVLLLAGALDPMEGSVVIAAGSALAAWVAVGVASRHRRLLAWGAVFTVAGVGALWGYSAVGGIGGTTGRSMWWGLSFVPYPVGWILSLVGAFKLVGELRRPR